MSLKAWGIKDLQNVKSLVEYFKGRGVSDLSIVLDATDAEIEYRLAEEMAAYSVVKAAREQRLSCEKCGGPAIAVSVNDSPATIIGGEYKSSILCRDRDCLHVEYSSETVNEISEKN